jgi:hypothetical protein
MGVDLIAGWSLSIAPAAAQCGRIIGVAVVRRRPQMCHAIVLYHDVVIVAHLDLPPQELLQQQSPRLSNQKLFPLSDRRASFPKLATTAHGSYKLSVPSALLGIQATSTHSCLKSSTRARQFEIFPKSVPSTAWSDLVVASVLQVRSCPLLSCFSTLICPWSSPAQPIALGRGRSPRTLHTVHWSRYHRGQCD